MLKITLSAVLPQAGLKLQICSRVGIMESFVTNISSSFCVTEKAEGIFILTFILFIAFSKAVCPFTFKTPIKDKRSSTNLFLIFFSFLNCSVNYLVLFLACTFSPLPLTLQALEKLRKYKFLVTKEIWRFVVFYYVVLLFVFFFNHPMYSALIPCLLYTSDAADDMQCVDLGGRRIIKKKKKIEQT
eukprot:TRINITY_DN27450_c0_g1_i1.p2 TRINITY_DN27450_c0_g1~~TRINITY_DN27450_c0_g1_i1.p2  ORF type:complete len:186 (-),score=6.98 TRINITY_DN27450_c0_g1_i1:102-659(-)